MPAKNNRRALRERFNLDAQPCGDGWAHCLLGPCAVCQEARELKVRRPAALSCCAALHKPLERCCAVLHCSSAASHDQQPGPLHTAASLSQLTPCCLPHLVQKRGVTVYQPPPGQFVAATEPPKQQAAVH